MPKGTPRTIEECEKALLNAADKVDGSLSRPKYRELDYNVSVTAITNNIGDGTWNGAKNHCNIETRGEGGALNVNESYFNNIEKEGPAYWLGFIFGDGSLPEPKVGSPCLSIGLQASDRNHLEKFKNAIGSEHKIQEGEAAAISIKNQSIADDLRDCGLVSNKTYANTVPEINKEIPRAAFIRGLFDADGHVGNYGRFNITGSSKARFEKLSQWIPVKASISDRGDGAFTFRVGSRERLIKLYTWLYPESDETKPKLQRKYNDVKDYICQK